MKRWVLLTLVFYLICLSILVVPLCLVVSGKDSYLLPTFYVWFVPILVLVQEALHERLAKFALKLEPKKTRLVEFGRFAAQHAKERGRKLETIYFLGFTHYSTRNRKGNFMVGHKTERSRFQRSVRKLTQSMRVIRHESVAEQAMQINQILRGHYAYYGIGGNLRSLQRLYRIAERYWHKMLCSRSRKSYVPWQKFRQMKLNAPLQQPRLSLPYAAMKGHAVL